MAPDRRAIQGFDGGAEPSMRPSADRDGLCTPPARSNVEPDILLDLAEQRVAGKGDRGALAYVEIFGPDDEHSPEAILDLQNPDTNYRELVRQIGDALGPRDVFCWFAGRFIILIDRSGTASRTLSRVSRGIANREWQTGGGSVHLTPVIGYFNVQSVRSARELWDMAEDALISAKSSLEIEPRIHLKAKPRNARQPTPIIRNWWRSAPQWLLLSVQLFISLLAGLGGPYVLYAVSDALGSDISGPVYIGVVVVLVITATTIWIEGFLALKPTTPPLAPGAPYPPATLIIPAYLPNEADTIMETLDAFLKIEYENIVQIIIAYNCPTPYMPVEDEMKALAAEHAAAGRFLIEPVRVLNSKSKAQNVNAVVGRVKGRFVGIFDADHHPHADSLERAWRWLSNGWDIVQGRCSIRNGTDNWVARMVAVEFEQIYAVSHPGRARFHGFGIFGGSNGFWRTAVLHETRMRHSMLTEDIDSSIRAVVAGYRITGDRDLVSEELAPTAIKQLLNQRLRWAQGWFQVSFRRVVPALLSPHVTVRQKFGLLHLLVWRELFPWYSIQVVPIMIYWVSVYGWAYIHWTVPVFLATTIFTLSTGPGQILLAYRLAQKPMRQRPRWFIEYLFVSTFFFSPFKDALSRIAHVKEAMGEKAWKVTPRVAPSAKPQRAAVAASLAMLLLAFVVPGDRAEAASAAAPRRSTTELLSSLLGGEAATINAARVAAREGRNAQAAGLFEKAIRDVPRRRAGLLREYADVLNYSNRSAEAVPLYREVLAATRDANARGNVGSSLALALTWSRQYGAALAVYNDLLARSPEDADAAVHRARVLAWLGRSDEAVAALDRLPPARWMTGQLASLGNEILIDSARNKARTGQTAAAMALYDRAMRRDRGNASLGAEYAGLAARGRTAASNAAPPAETIASYRAVLARTSPGSAASRTALRGLAVMLSSGKATDQAVDAWSAYLRTAPGDVDAILHRAGLLFQMHRDGQARAAFQAAYAIDRQNRAARAGIFDTTVNLARAAAREDRNGEATGLFAAAITIDPGRRQGLLREYADQLSFTGRAAEAMPLYREALAAGTLSPADRKQAAIGLANSYMWSDRLKDALTAYDGLVAAHPDDPGLRWTRLVVAARDAARTDRNGEAARLFADAIALDPVQGMGIMREYADQLAFTSRAELAIPLYLKILARSDLASADRLAARNGLAQAYEWSGRLDLARSTYTGTLALDPGDIPLRWKLLVVSAREYARQDHNRESAELFARAIKLRPQQSAGILREYADQLSFTGRAETAIGFYTVALEQPGLTMIDRSSINHGLARAYDWAGRHADAKAAYTALLAETPRDPVLQWHLLVVSARMAAAEDRNKDAAQQLAQAIRLLPGQRLSILKEYADKLAYSSRPKLAVPLYREVLKQDLPTVDARDAALALALALGWDHQFDASLQEYKRLADADPDDIEVALGMARTMSLAGRQSDAKAVYERIIAARPRNGEAQRGLAQAEDWEGHHRAAQALLVKRLDEEPDDLEARRLLAQSLVWSGRPDKALEEVHRALQYQQQPRSRGRRPATELSTATGWKPGTMAGLDDNPLQLVGSGVR